MAKLYTRLKINETYRAANTDDLADLGGFSVALKKGQVSYSVTIYVDGKLVKTEKNVFNAKGESIDHWHDVNDTLKLSHLPRSMFKKRGVKVSHC